MAKVRPTGPCGPLNYFCFPFCKMHPLNAIFEEHFWNLFCREIFKKCKPLYPLDFWLMYKNNLRPQNIQNYWKWPVTKKVWSPLSYKVRPTSKWINFVPSTIPGDGRYFQDWHLKLTLKLEMICAGLLELFEFNIDLNSTLYKIDLT